MCKNWKMNMWDAFAVVGKSDGIEVILGLANTTCWRYEYAYSILLNKFGRDNYFCFLF